MSMDKPNDHDLLVTLSEQVKNLREALVDLKVDIRELKDGIMVRIQNLEDNKEDKREVARLWNELHEVNKTFVTVAEFSPIKKIVYGCVTAILVAFMGALVYLVIPKSSSTSLNTNTPFTQNP